MKKVKIMLAAVSAVTLIFTAGCAEKKDSTGNNIVYYDDSNAYSQAIEGVEDYEGNVVKEEDLIENVPTTPAKINQVEQIGGVDINVLNIYDLGIIKAHDFINYDRQAIALICEITNNTDEEIDVNSFDMQIEYMEGERSKITTCMESTLRAMETISDLESFNTTIAPGETIKGYSAFAVYQRWESLTFYYTPTSYEGEDALTYDVTRDMVQKFK